MPKKSLRKFKEEVTDLTVQLEDLEEGTYSADFQLEDLSEGSVEAISQKINEIIHVVNMIIVKVNK